MRFGPPLKIRYLIPTLKTGGTENHVIRLAAGLKHRGHDTGIICVFQKGPLGEEAEREGVPLVLLEAGERWGGRASVRIWNRLRSNPVQVLHTYLFGAHLFAGLPARLLGVPAVLSSRRGRAVTHWQRKREQWLENLGNLFVDRVTCCSRENKEWVLANEKISAEKVVTIYNGIDGAEFGAVRAPVSVRRGLGIPDEALLVGTVANFAPEKGYPYFLESMRTLLRRDSRIWFLLVGSGPLEEEIRGEAGKIPGRERIVFAGTRPDIPDLMNAMDIFVLASVTEGFPNVLLEAMALARPVVATRVGGIPELVHSGEDGILVPPRDAEALAEGVLILAKDRERAAALGERARRKIKKDFTLDRMIDEYEALYLSLLQGKESKAPQRDMLQPCAG